MVFTLSLLFIAGDVIKNYGDLDEIGNQFLSEEYIIEDENLNTALLQPESVIVEEKTAIKQYDVKPPLNLILMGTIIGDRAITCIKDLATGREGVYKVGEIVSGARIMDIQRGRVAVERNGRRDFLIF